MEKIPTMAAFAAAVLCIGAPGCAKFDDSEILNRLELHERMLEEHERRIALLETLCKKLNSDLESLAMIVEVIDGRLYVTDHAPVTEDGTVIGYNIRFSDGSVISIFNGRNGKDGKDGKDGRDGKDACVPAIGARADEHGTICWTVNGEWLLDAEGKHVPCTGKDGEDGVDGIDGIIPLLRINEEGWWEISYDGGETFTLLGNATGEKGDPGEKGDKGETGEKGDPGEDGTSEAGIFRSIEAVTGEDGAVYLVITLMDGTVYRIRTEE